MKRKYIILIVILVLISSFVIYLFVDFSNDKRYLASQGFDKQSAIIYKDIKGYDNYCKNDGKDYSLICDISYQAYPLNPSFGMNIDFGDNTELSYMRQVHGMFKHEYNKVYITTDVKRSPVGGNVCQVDDEFKVIDNDDNSAFCYTDEYTKFIEDNREYIDDAMKKFNSYYDNFNMARSYYRI